MLCPAIFFFMFGSACVLHNMHLLNSISMPSLNVGCHDGEIDVFFLVHRLRNKLSLSSEHKGCHGDEYSVFLVQTGRVLSLS